MGARCTIFPREVTDIRAKRTSRYGNVNDESIFFFLPSIRNDENTIKYLNESSYVLELSGAESGENLALANTINNFIFLILDK